MKITITTVTDVSARGVRYEKKEIGTGKFHKWGCCYEEFETGAGNYSTAIIELADGTILNHPVELVKFTDT